MRNIKSIWLASFLVFLAITSSEAQDDSLHLPLDSISLARNDNLSVIDSSKVSQLNFSDEQVQRLKSELNYKEPPTVAESLWDRFKHWLAEIISKLVKGATTTNLGRLIMYVVGGILLIWVIMSLMKVNAFRVFFSGGDIPQSSYQILDEDIHEMDFENLIGEAVGKKDFRLATRLLFLYALKILSDKQLINWSPGKTNHEYVSELERTDLRPSFNDLSIYFDYAWYGNFDVSSENFKKVQGIFQSLKEQVNK